MKHVKDFLLHLAEVDKYVAATDEVQLRKRRILDQVVLRKDAPLPQVLVDLIAALDLREKEVETLRGNVSRNVFGILCGASLFNRRRTEIGSKDLHREGSIGFSHVFLQHDGNRNRFLSRGATRNPDPNRIIGEPPLEKPGEDHCLQRFERFLIPEEPRYAHEQVLVERL